MLASRLEVDVNMAIGSSSTWDLFSFKDCHLNQGDSINMTDHKVFINIRIIKSKRSKNEHVNMFDDYSSTFPLNHALPIYQIFPPVSPSLESQQ